MSTFALTGRRVTRRALADSAVAFALDPRLVRISWLVLLAIGLVFGFGWAVSGAHPVDGLLYWRTDLDHLYGTVWGESDSAFFVYPPVLAQLMVPIRALGWPLFIGLWTFILFAATAYAGRFWAVVLVLVGLVLLPFVGFAHPLQHPLLYPLIGNIQPLLVALLIAGFRYPALWAPIILTKIGPGVGVLWFAFRREWSNFATALVATAVIAAVSFVLAPSLWFDFAAFAVRNVGAPSPTEVVPIPFWARAVMSVALLWWGARSDRRWVVPIAAGWSAIALYQWSFVEFWMAAPVVWAMDRRATATVRSESRLAAATAGT